MHSMPNFCGSWRGIETRVERQTTTSSHVFVRHPWETCSFTLFSESVFTLNHQTFTYFVQRRSFLSSCYHFNLKQDFKVSNLVPMTMQHGCCHWSRALWQVSSRACSCKKDPCCKRPALRKMAVPSPIEDVKLVSPISTQTKCKVHFFKLTGGLEQNIGCRYEDS